MIEDANGLFMETDPITGTIHQRSPEFVRAKAKNQATLAQQKKDAETALGAALVSLAPHLPLQQDGPPQAIAPNGRPYVRVEGEVTSDNLNQGYSSEGYKTSAAAIASWKRCVLEFAAINPGDILWWRVRPEIDARIPFGQAEARWMVYSRFMIGTAGCEKPQAA